MKPRERLLSYLKENMGDWVSGESLGRTIGISRSAIWKHVRKLREEGYGIGSSREKGYCLLSISEMLLPREIAQGLDTEVYGRKEIIHYRETGSTNVIAKKLAARGAPEGTLVVSEKQTQGRGRKGRVWFSPAEAGIYASLILRPAMTPGEAPQITFLTAVSAAETLIHLTRLDVRIKWPNDLLVKGKKIAGILTEISTGQGLLEYAVVGLGINVNTPAFPDEIRQTATSILVETGERFSRTSLIREYLRRQETYFRRLKIGGFEPILNRWKELADTIGRRIRVEMPDKVVVGRAEDIDPQGVLILRDTKGVSYRIVSGDVTLM